MGKRTILAASILMLLAVFCPCVFALDSAESVRTAMPQAAACRILPVDPKIGQLCDWTSSAAHETLFKALGEPYSLAWVEEHIEASMRSALVRLYGAWLSENLGSKDILLSLGHQNPDGSVGINVRVNGSCMAFLLQDGKVIAMRSLD